MKRTLSVLLMLFLPLQVCAITLKIATLAPDGTRWMQEMRSGAAEIKQRTEGRVKLRFYPGGIMGNDNSVLRKIRVGQLHGGVLTSGGLASIWPDIQIYNIPFLFRSFDEVDYVRKRMDPVIIEGLKKKNFISFGLGEGGFAYLMCQQPIENLSGLQKLKIWSPEGDRISREAFEALGVTPIPLPLTDVLTGLQTGLVNTVASSPVGAIAVQWHTKVKYLIDVPLIYLYGTLVIHQRALKKLSDKDRAIVAEVMKGHFNEINREARKDNMGARKALKKQGISFNKPPSEELNHWRGRVEKAVVKLKQQGEFTEQMHRKILQHLENYRSR